jgi:hypothetical protein
MPKHRHELEEQGRGFLTSATSESGIDIGGAEDAERLAALPASLPRPSLQPKPRLTQPQYKSNQNTREQNGTVGNVAVAAGSKKDAAAASNNTAVAAASSNKAAAAAASNNNAIAVASSDKATAAEDNTADRTP